MIHDQGLPLFLWAEGCYTAIYLQNRSPHRAVGSMNPEEAFSGTKPEVEHFRIFGCVVVLIHTCKRELSPAHLVCPWRHNA
jgi:hypothetical protein